MSLPIDDETVYGAPGGNRTLVSWVEATHFTTKILAHYVVDHGGNRTLDLLIAKQALSRLSYGPEIPFFLSCGSDGWIRTTGTGRMRALLCL